MPCSGIKVWRAKRPKVRRGAYGAPRAWAFLTYSNTGDRKSPLFDAQLQRFSEKNWRDVLFTEEQISADSGLTEKVIFKD